MMREDRVFIWCLLLAMLFVVLIVLLSGCGLGGFHIVKSGSSPPPESTSLGGAALDAAAQAEQAGWGDLAQVLGGAVGCGGIVAVARKALRDRAKRKEAKQDKLALREIIAGVQEVREKSGLSECGAIDTILDKYQQNRSTWRIVANTKIDQEDVTDKN